MCGDFDGEQGLSYEPIDIWRERGRIVHECVTDQQFFFVHFPRELEPIYACEKNLFFQRVSFMQIRTVWIVLVDVINELNEFFFAKSSK